MGVVLVVPRLDGSGTAGLGLLLLLFGGAMMAFPYLGLRSLFSGTNESDRVSVTVELTALLGRWKELRAAAQ